MSNRSGRWCTRGLCVATLALMAAAAVRAQEATSSIRGTVLDPSDAAIAHAEVSATQTETGWTRRVESDADGSYLFVLLPVGHYRVEATADGFQKYVQDGVTLSVNQVGIVPIRLTVGSSQQSVQVNADATLVQTTNDLGKTVLERDILDLPLNGRNFSQLGLLQPGVAPLTAGLKNAGGPLRAGQAYAVNGLRPESNQFLIDGVENFDAAQPSGAPAG